MEDVFITLNLKLTLEIVEALKDARENTTELLVSHDPILGRGTKRNRLTAEMYKEEISRIDGILSEFDHSL